MNPDTRLSSELIEWFWQHGRSRGRPAPAGAVKEDRTKYDLPPDKWLAKLYDARDDLSSYTEALKPRRPALALWGLSQTGKSTALAFVDAGHEATGNPSTDGVGTGLHWEGGLPFIYQAPFKIAGGPPLHWSKCVYNPYNQGNDGSSCLTRLVVGTRTGDQGTWKVTDPMHPVGLLIQTPLELLVTIARGFDSQCWGPERAGRHAPWSASDLEDIIAKVQARYGKAGSGEDPEARKEPDRAAFEAVRLLVRVLEDLFTVRIERYAKIATDLQSLRSWLDNRMLSQPWLTGNMEAADALMAEILWGGSEFITRYYRKLRELQTRLIAAWEGAELRASLQSAMLVINMNSSVDIFKQWEPNTSQGIQAGLIRELGWRREGDKIWIGCGPDYPEKLGRTPEDYATFQCLIWEIILAINIDRLPDSEAKRLLATADILDFPGVGREELNENTRLNIDGNAGPGHGKNPETTDFYAKILKRGKTASIVTSYSRRMNIDTFAIMQTLVGDQPPSPENVNQIIDGCSAWRRFAGFDESDFKARYGSRLPLAFVLTFWGAKVINFNPNNATNFENGCSKWYVNYGFIAEGEVSTVFALNYHWFGTPVVSLTGFDRDSDTYKKVVQEAAFTRLFREADSRESFDQMVHDQKSGGLAFFYTKMSERLARTDFKWRQARLERLVATRQEEVRALLDWPELRAPRIERDLRSEVLQDFRRRAIELNADAGEEKMRSFGHALRNLLNVDAELLPATPATPGDITPSLVDQWFHAWKESQLQAFEAWNASGRKSRPDWALLGFSSRAQLETVIKALVDVLGQPIFSAIARESARRAELIARSTPDLYEHNLRRCIAVEMANRLIYLDPSDPEASRRTQPGAETDDPESQNRDFPCLRTRAYKEFSGLWLDNQLSALLRNIAPPRKRPPLPGDPELDQVVDSVNPSASTHTS
jgi:hypothetical protein